MNTSLCEVVGQTLALRFRTSCGYTWYDLVLFAQVVCWSNMLRIAHPWIGICCFPRVRLNIRSSVCFCVCVWVIMRRCFCELFGQ